MNDNTFLDDTSADNADTDQALRDAFGALSGAFAAIDNAGVISAVTDGAAASGAPLLTVVSDPEVESQLADTEPPLHGAASGPRRHALRWALVAAALIAATAGGWAISRYRSNRPSVVRSVSPTKTVIPSADDAIWVPTQWPKYVQAATQVVRPADTMSSDLLYKYVKGPTGAIIEITAHPDEAYIITEPETPNPPAHTSETAPVEISENHPFVSGTWSKGTTLYQALYSPPGGAEPISGIDAVMGRLADVITEPFDIGGSLPDGWTLLDKTDTAALRVLIHARLALSVSRDDAVRMTSIATLEVPDAPEVIRRAAALTGQTTELVDGTEATPYEDPQSRSFELAWAPDERHVAVARVSTLDGKEIDADVARASAEMMMRTAKLTPLDQAGPLATAVADGSVSPGDHQISLVGEGTFPSDNHFEVYERFPGSGRRITFVLSDRSQMKVAELTPGNQPVATSSASWTNEGMWTQILQVAAKGKHDPAKIRASVGRATIAFGGYYDEATDTTHAFGLVANVSVDQRPAGPYKDLVVSLGD